MKCLIREVDEADGPAVVAIFNQYAQEPASFMDRELPPQAFDQMRAETRGYPFLVAEVDGRVAGFGFLRQFHFSPLMRRTAATSYFLDHDHRGAGLGSRLLAGLEERARAMEVDNLVAPIMSENHASQAFHRVRGFALCGRVEKAGVKSGRDFGVVFMQKILES